MYKNKALLDDPIIEEIHAIRARHASDCNNDLKAMFDDIMRRQKSSGRKYVNLAVRTKLPATAVCEDSQNYGNQE
jgi:hypothetical protein